MIRAVLLVPGEGDPHGLLREGLGEHVRLHVHPHFPAWEKRVREALGDG